MTTDDTARKFFAQRCDFILAAAEPAHFPKTTLPEIAFIGRSNVGKSSLINALTGRKALARTSSTPGRTQQIVFFNLADRLILVDLPGYGHAKAPPDEKKRWNRLVETYLRKRENLKCVCLLLDGGHEMKSNDLEMMSFLDRAAVVYKLVLTKMDRKAAQGQAESLRQVETYISAHPAALSGLISTSSEDKTGLSELRSFLLSQYDSQ